MKKVVLAICTVVMLSISSNAFSMGFFPTVAPTPAPASTEGKSDWKPIVNSTSQGMMYNAYSPSTNIMYSAFPKTSTAYRIDDAKNETTINYTSFWDKFGSIF